MSKNKKVLAEAGRMYQKGQWSMVWHRFRKNKSAMLGLILLIMLVVVALSAVFLVNYQTDVVGMDMANRMQSPSGSHILGTDHYGRDIFARIIYGARISLSMAVIIILVSFTAGGAIGAVAGYFGGWVDNILMRIMDVFYAIPFNLFAICVVAALGGGTFNLIMAMSIALIPMFSRIVRSAVLPICGQEYIESARACGTSHFRIIVKHVIPNAIGPIIVHATLNIADTIKAIAGLSFIGLGIAAPLPEWGAMLTEGKNYIREYPYLVVVPGVAIMIAAMSFNLIGDGLRDALDPRLKN